MAYPISVHIRPYLEGVRYRTAMTKDQDQIVFRSPESVREEDGKVHNPKLWRREDLDVMRERLMQVQGVEDALAFAGEYGPLVLENGTPSAASLDDFKALQHLVREALLRPDNHHLDIGWEMGVTLQQGSPIYGFLRCDSVSNAIRASLFVDRLRGNAWQECEVCGKVFEKVGGRLRRFCSQKCGAAQSYRELKEKKAQDQRSVTVAH